MRQQPKIKHQSTHYSTPTSPRGKHGGANGQPNIGAPKGKPPRGAKFRAANALGGPPLRQFFHFRCRPPLLSRFFHIFAAICNAQQRSGTIGRWKIWGWTEAYTPTKRKAEHNSACPSGKRGCQSFLKKLTWRKPPMARRPQMAAMPQMPQCWENGGKLLQFFYLNTLCLRPIATDSNFVRFFLSFLNRNFYGTLTNTTFAYWD